MVPGAGLEPARNIIPRDFKSLVSTNSTISAFPACVEDVNASNRYNLERLLYIVPLIFVPKF